MTSTNLTIAFALSLASLTLVGCPKEEKLDGDKLPTQASGAPSASSAAGGVCGSGGGTDSDQVSEPFFPRMTGGYCLDPQGDVKTYGDKGKLSMDDVCTTAFDGECEIYKNFGLARVVTLRYVDGMGHAGSVEVVLSQFKNVDGAYGMFTKRVIADGDPTDPSAPHALAVNGGGGAIGTGRAYVWRGPYVAELQYINEQESPAQLAKSSLPVLRALATQLGSRLPAAEKPASAKALPMVNLVPNGIDYRTKDPFAIEKIGDGALGFYRDYKDPTKRWRGLSIVRADADAAKDAFKLIRTKPGAIPIPAVPGLFDEGVRVTLSTSETSPKTEWTIVRKGEAIAGIGDEEYALIAAGAPEKQASARVGKDEEMVKLKAWLSAPPVGSGSEVPVLAGIAAMAAMADGGAKVPKNLPTSAPRPQ